MREICIEKCQNERAPSSVKKTWTKKNDQPLAEGQEKPEFANSFFSWPSAKGLSNKAYSGVNSLCFNFENAVQCLEV